eukprot:31429-Pelagococcus_subviridis.AAC.3
MPASSSRRRAGRSRGRRGDEHDETASGAARLAREARPVFAAHPLPKGFWKGRPDIGGVVRAR